MACAIYSNVWSICAIVGVNRFSKFCKGFCWVFDEVWRERGVGRQRLTVVECYFLKALGETPNSSLKLRLNQAGSLKPHW